MRFSRSDIDGSIVSVKCNDPTKEWGIMLRRNRKFSVDPLKKIEIKNLDQPLELIDFGLCQARNVSVCESSHDQIHLTGATTPRPKQDTAAARVEIGARMCRSGHTITFSTAPGAMG